MLTSNPWLAITLRKWAIIFAAIFLFACGQDSPTSLLSDFKWPDPSTAIRNETLLSGARTKTPTFRANVPAVPPPMAAPGTATTGEGAVTVSLSVTNLLDWAESAYPAIFPQHQLNQSAQSYTYRYYPSTQNYIGVSNGNVYILGPVSRGVLTQVGAMADFTCDLMPFNCDTMARATSPVPTSGAILIYLAEKTGQFLPQHSNDRVAVLEWLMFQVGGLGPAPGQVHHFLSLDHEEDRRYGLNRFMTETQRLYKVMNERLGQTRYFANALSIADFALLGWVWRHPRHQISLDDYTNVNRWYQ